MKHKFLSLSTVALVILATVTMQSCKKYTEVEPGSQYSVPEAFSDASNAFSSLVGVYDELQGDNGYGIRINLYYPYDSDEGMVSGDIDLGRRDIGRYRLLLTNADLANPFRQLYRGVEKANLFIDQVQQMRQYTSGTATEQKDLRRMHGEALTIRAQLFYELIRNWGDVPAPMIPAYKQTNLFIPQADRDSTYNKILSDLAIAKTMLPWRTEVARNERITKGAAMALRARIALFRGGYSLRQNGQMERKEDYQKFYEIARDECAELMANRNQHTLNPSFESVWRNVTSFVYDPQGEILFEVGAGGGNSNSDSRMGNYDGPNLNAASRYGQGGGGIVMLPSYFYSFDSVDTRRDVTITSYQVTNATNIKSQRTLGQLNTGKYRRDWRVPLLPGQALNPGFNWVVIRFSDVLLMYAEAVNELNNGPTTQAISALEEVRKRAFRGNATLIGTTPTDKAEFFNALVNERYLEFGHEGIRKYDLIRWNMLSSKIAETRIKLQQIRDRQGVYANVPQYIYWKNNGEEIIYYAGSNTATTAVPWYKPTQVPPSGVGSNPATQWVRVNWAENLNLTRNAAGNLVGASVDGMALHEGFARFFVSGKSELFPYDQSTLQTYQGRIKQNPGYPQ